MYFTSVLVSSTYILDTGKKNREIQKSTTNYNTKNFNYKIFREIQKFGTSTSIFYKKKNSWIKVHNFSIFRSPKRKPEDKALKEKRNQAAGQQLKASSAVLKREKPISSSDRRSAKSSSGDKTTRTRPSTAKSGMRTCPDLSKLV